MNQQLQRTSLTQPPPFYHANHYYPQTLHPSVSQNIVYQTMTYPIDVYHNNSYNHLNIRKPQTQSYIYTTPNEGFDPNRRLMLDSFGRKAIYYEYNVGQSNSTAQSKIVQPNRQKIQPLNYAQCKNQSTQSIKKPLYTSQIWINQNSDINFSSKAQPSDQKRLPPQFSSIRDQNNQQLKNVNNTKDIITQSLYDGIEVKSHRDLTTLPSQLNYQQINHHQTSTMHQPSTSNDLKMKPLKDSTVFLNVKPNLTYKLANKINIKIGQPCTKTSQITNPLNCVPICKYKTEEQTPIFLSQGRKNQKQGQKKENIKGFFQFRKKKPNDSVSNSLHRSYAYSIKDFSLNDFQLLDKIGKGSFGDVFIAQEKITGFVCVIKKLSKKKLIEMKLQQHLFRQIKIQSFLKHRHLTQLYGFFHDENYIYLILEIMSDGSLMQVNKKKKIPESQVSNYLKQICEGLKYMHTEQIIHRDIKPQNIFIHEGYAKIGDFGCSIYTQSLRNTVVGSLAYISPQQLQQGFYDQKIDVWSLGVMAYQMLYGKSPYQQDIIKIARQQMGPNLSILKFPPQIQISAEAMDFILNTLHLDSNHRIGIIQALKHPFIRKYERKDQFVFEKCVI